MVKQAKHDADGFDVAILVPFFMLLAIVCGMAYGYVHAAPSTSGPRTEVRLACSDNNSSACFYHVVAVQQ